MTDFAAGQIYLGAFRIPYSFILFFASLMVALILTPLVRALAIRVGAFDHPGPRRIHDQPVPTLGGLAIAGAVRSVAWAAYLLPGPIEPLGIRPRLGFTLASVPNALADAQECAARASGGPMPDPLPLEYGNGFGMMVRFKTRNGDAPVLRLLWRNENGAWKITSYIVELP